MRDVLWCVMLLAALVSAACGGGDSEPALPASVTPGWTRTAFNKDAAPKGLPSGGTAPVCWKAAYTIAAQEKNPAGTANVWACRYTADTMAFDAVQRMLHSADTVQFQEGPWLVVAQWSGASNTDRTSLVRAVQKNLRH